MAQLHKGWTMKKLLLTAVVLAAGVLLATPALARDPAPQVDQSTGGDIKKEKKIEVEVVRGPNGRKKIIIKTPLELFAIIQRPNAFYILERTPLKTGVTPLDRGFTNKILDSVRKSPF